LPGTYLPAPFPTSLAEYTARFPNSCIIEGSWQSLRIYDSNNARSQIVDKLNKVAPITQTRAENLYTLASISGPEASTTLLLNINALPFTIDSNTSFPTSRISVPCVTADRTTQN